MRIEGIPKPVDQGTSVRRNERKETPKRSEEQSEQAPVTSSVPAPKEKNDAAKADETAARVEKVAQQLNLAFTNSEIRFKVKDPTSTSSNNIVIEVVRNDRVVARIPDDTARVLTQEVEVADKSDLKGTLVDIQG